LGASHINCGLSRHVEKSQDPPDNVSVHLPRTIFIDHCFKEKNKEKNKEKKNKEKRHRRERQITCSQIRFFFSHISKIKKKLTGYLFSSIDVATAGTAAAHVGRGGASIDILFKAL